VAVLVGGLGGLPGLTQPAGEVGTSAEGAGVFGTQIFIRDN
jgi:hypothetical protein